jgi:superfamily II DNA or RNA helicase
LFLALPISWRGTLQQYAGRLHRVHADKTDIRIYDYVDDRVAVLAKMYERRLRGYRAMGYTIRDAAIESGLNLDTGKMPRNTEPRTRT